MKMWHCFWPKNVKEGGEIVFPSGVRIAFAGYANGNKIMGKVGKFSGYYIGINRWNDTCWRKRNLNW